MDAVTQTAAMSSEQLADTPLVHAEGLSLAFGGQQVLCDVTFTIPKGAAVLLRGGNGSGKTSLLNVLSGFLRPQRGHVHMILNGRGLDALRTSPERLAHAGVGRLWQDIRLFPTMTVLENVLAATPGLAGAHPLLTLTAWPKVKRRETTAREQAMANLEQVGMADRAHSSGDRLSVGQMKRVAIARLLQARAELLLLDEPLAGLDEASVQGLTQLLDELNQRQGKTLLIVEHRHEHMTGICGHTWYLADGRLDTGGR